MADHLQNAKYRLEHAMRHIDDFKKKCAVFAASGPCEKVIEKEGLTEVHKIKVSKPIPVELHGLAFDIVSNLRSALDLLGHEIAVAAGGGDNGKFPFGDEQKAVEGQKGK